MRTVNIHEAKTHLSRLLEDAVNGKPFIIAKSGKPLVTVSKIGAAKPVQGRRTGFLVGRFAVPDDFDRLGTEEIDRLFGADSE
jgi:prevent-host-death family protein